MSTDSVLAAYDPKGALRKALRESQERSASERAARAPRQAMPRDEAPATPLSEEEELFRDVVGDVLSRVSLPPSPAPRQGVAGAVSPAPAVSNANEDVGQRRDGRQGAVTPPLSDTLPAGHTVVSPKVMPQHGGVTTFSDTRSHRITVRVSEEEYDAYKRRATALNVPVSAWLRAAALHVLDAATPPLEAAAQAAAPESAQTAQAIEQLRREGVNLNQALRRGSMIDPERVRGLARAVDDLRASLGDKTVITSSTQTAQAIEQLRRLKVNLNQALKRGLVIDPKQAQDLARSIDDLRASLGDKTVITS